jgi:hypothetical protein
MGRIRSIDRVLITKRGAKKPVKGRILLGRKNKPGYIRVWVSTTKSEQVHRLVANTFIPNPLNKPCVNHINAIPSDNRVSNIEWVTYSENTIHALDNGLTSLVGHTHRDSKLTKTQVIEIYHSELTPTELSVIYHTTEQNISNIKIGKIWHRVTGAKYIKKDVKYLSEEMVLTIFNANMSYKDISQKYGVNIHLIGQIKTGRKWSKITGKVFSPIYKTENKRHSAKNYS